MRKYFFIFFFGFFLISSPVFATGSFTEAQCNLSPAKGGQGGTCKKTLLGGCENGVQTEVGTCSDTNMDNVCCVPNPPGMSVDECTTAPSNGGLGGQCLNGMVCDDANEKGFCPETGFGIDTYCCVTPGSIADAEEESGVAAVGNVNIGTKYTPLENVPFIQGTTFQSYIEGIYKLALVLIVLSAVFMLVIGGFTYLTSAGNTHQMGSAKEIIYGAIIGLILALVSYIILNTINPDLVNLNVSSFQPLAVQTGSVPGGGQSGGGTVVSSLSAQEAARKLLSHPNVTLGTSSGNNCPGGNASAKDNLEQVAAGRGMTRCPCGGGGSVAASPVLLNSLVDIAEAGGRFRINFIAGACHSSGSNHYSGTSADLQRTPGSALDAFFARYPRVNSGPTYQVSGVKVWFEDASHYHVSPTGR